MPDTAPVYQQTYIATDGSRHSYDIPAVSVSEMVMYALKFLNYTPRDHGTFESYQAAMDEANRFANFCIGETVAEDGKWCDPTRSFGDLWTAFVKAESGE